MGIFSRLMGSHSLAGSRVRLAPVALLCALHASQALASEPVREIVDAKDVKQLSLSRSPAPLVFLDASPQDVHQRVRITGAQRVAELDAEKSLLPKSATLVIYDFSLGAGGALEAVPQWRQAGFSSVQALRGGEYAARNAAIPVEIHGELPYTVTAKALSAALKNGETPVLVDLRSDIEHATSHIEGAVSSSPDKLLALSSSWGKNQWVVLYDAAGNSLDPMIWQLRKAGFLQTVSIGGGFAEWLRGDAPVKRKIPLPSVR